jgi:hypothetical protein
MSKDSLDGHKWLKGHRNWKDIAQRLGGVSLQKCEDLQLKAQFNYTVTDKYDKEQLVAKGSTPKAAIVHLFEALKRMDTIIVKTRQDGEIQYDVKTDIQTVRAGSSVVETDNNIYLQLTDP